MQIAPRRRSGGGLTSFWFTVIVLGACGLLLIPLLLHGFPKDRPYRRRPQFVVVSRDSTQGYQLPSLQQPQAQAQAQAPAHMPPRPAAVPSAPHAPPPTPQPAPAPAPSPFAMQAPTPAGPPVREKTILSFPDSKVPPPPRFDFEAIEAKPDPNATPQSKSRRAEIVSAFKHGWDAYKSVCFGRDELLPLSRKCEDWLHLGLTIVDSLDTLIIMGLDKEYRAARDWVDQELHFELDKEISFFETIIRMVGGLESAFDLTGDKMFLDKAHALTDKLLGSFSSFGIPKSSINLKTGQSSNPIWAGGCSILAEIGTLQPEFMYLSHYTGDPKYYDKAHRVMEILDAATLQIKGLYPIYLRPENGVFMNSKICWGAMGDSVYEYILKTWLITGRSNDKYRTMYQTSMKAMEEHLLKREAGMTYITELSNGQPINKMDHLVCFAPGMLALGAASGAVDKPTGQRHMQIATELMETCVKMYTMNPSGIAPEFVSFHSMGMAVGSSPAYRLRPETVESLFILWRLTHDQKYRDWGWTIFTAINKQCRVPTGGFAGLQNVHAPSVKEDKMESYFLAETLKYLYLLFSPDHVVPLNEFVFNTEAHPLRMGIKRPSP